MAQLDGTRAEAANAYLIDHASLVEAHPGAAFAESVILAGMVNQTPSGVVGLLGDAYLADLMRAVLAVPDRGQAYRLTHAIMFASDFGRNQLSLPAGYETLLEQLVITYAEDTDVLGEVLISARCIGYWSSSMDVAYASFCDQWDALDRSAEGFAETYHGVLVGGLLFALVV